MDVSILAKKAAQTVSTHSPVILTATAVAGVVTTSILSVKAAFKAAEIINGNDRDEWPVNDLKEQINLTWKCYIPPAFSAASTIAAVIAAHQIGSRRNAALLSLYSVTDTAFREYKDKVVEQIGIKKEQTVRDSIAEDRVTANPPSSEVVIVGSGEILFCESMSGRYFKSTVETVRRAQNDINSAILNGDMSASQNEFNSAIGLGPTGYGETVGWNIDNLIDVQFSAVKIEDGSDTAMYIGYAKMPIVNFHKVY